MSVNGEQQPLEWVYDSVTDDAAKLVQRTIDAAFPAVSEQRHGACIQAGKALITTGICFFGVGVGINDPERILPQLKAFFDEFQAKVMGLVRELEG